MTAELCRREILQVNIWAIHCLLLPNGRAIARAAGALQNDTPDTSPESRSRRNPIDVRGASRAVWTTVEKKGASTQESPRPSSFDFVKSRQERHATEITLERFLRKLRAAIL